MNMFQHVSLLNLAFSILFIVTIYIVVEGLRRFETIRGEVGRKYIHIATGVFIAAMPIFASRTEVIVINSLIFLWLIATSWIHLFKAYEDVDRWSIGQFLYPLSIILAAFIFEDPLIFSFAVLELALADGFAALFGKKYGLKTIYHIPGGVKSFVGSGVFMLITLSLMLVYISLAGGFDAATIAMVVLGAFSLTVVEGMIAAGLDNIVLPVLMGIILQQLG